jgi:hypothetical protein
MTRVELRSDIVIGLSPGMRQTVSSATEERISHSWQAKSRRVPRMQSSASLPYLADQVFDGIGKAIGHGFT